MKYHVLFCFLKQPLKVFENVCCKYFVDIQEVMDPHINSIKLWFKFKLLINLKN